MIERRVPAWFARARDFASRVPSPVGKPIAAAKKGERAELYIYDAIGKDVWTDGGISPDDVLAALAEAKGASALDVHINSPGGGVFDGIAIANAIRAFAGPKTVYVDGIAASIATVIALAGDRVVMNEGSMFMVHDPAGGLLVFDTADRIEDEAAKTVQALRKVRQNLIDIYVSATGRKADEVSAWMAKETWMTAAETRDFGFADEVMESEPAEEPKDERKPRVAAQASYHTIASQARDTVRALRNEYGGASPSVAGKPAGTESKQSKEKQR
jgi:ATP-dependent protease ClpP protease subunit